MIPGKPRLTLGVWNNETAPDSSRAKALHEIATFGYLYSQPDSAFYFAQMMFDFASKKGLKMEMAEFMINRKQEKEAEGNVSFEMRVGIHTGPVVAGIVGVAKFQYDIWGDTVNTASRMENSGEEGKINISQATYELIKDDPTFKFQSRGKVEAKGKGAIEMWFVEEV